MNERKIRKLLETSVFNDTRTVDLMDRFEGYGEDVSYLQLVLRNIACLNIGGNYEYISLVVERSKDHRYIGNITFTELKQGATKNLYAFLRTQISEDVISTYKDTNEEFRFDTPYLFRAQNSSNRSGYGWGYGGTQYGETTAYVFVGAYIGYKKYGFADEINMNLESADLTEFTVKNHSDNSEMYVSDYEPRDIYISNDGEDIDEINFLDILELTPNEDINSDIEYEIEFIAEKRNISDDSGKPDWFYAGFNPEINLFILALEQKVYLPPIIDECEKVMMTDENLQDDAEFMLSNLERSFMFVEMMANAIGYSGISVLSLDPVHKRKILNTLLLRNIDGFEYGEYEENSISFHLVADFLENQPGSVYRGFVEIILTKYQDYEGEDKYELVGGFRDFGDIEVPYSERCYWTGKDRYVLDEGREGSYLQGIYEMAMNY